MKCFALLVVVLSVVCAINAEPARHGGRGHARFHSRPKLARFVDESTAEIAADEPAGGEVADGYPELYPPLLDDSFIPPNDQPDIPVSDQADAPPADEPSVKLDDEQADGSAPLVKNGNGAGNIFFPVDFKNHKGGAIAIANSFSTGKGGTATSHAVAYGSKAK